jgi:hypothetical protein
MPDIKITQEVDYDVNIDVYCGTCGNGLCCNTTVDDRRMSFTVEACPDCMYRKDEEIKANIKANEEEIERLENEIEKLKEIITEHEKSACV